ncbi:MAG: response regulator [Ferruginibacter sp.]
MNKNPIVIVDDDNDDRDLLIEAFKEVGAKNEFRHFDNVRAALEYLRSTEEKTFLIICDVNMPRINGVQFKKEINNDKVLNDKRIPFIFFSTSTDINDIRQAYSLCAHGYFKKPEDLPSFNKIARSIMEYWMSNELSEEV